MTHFHRHAPDAVLESAGTAERSLSREEALRRATQVAAVDYALDLAFDGDAPTYRGAVTIDFDLVGDPAGLFLDFAGKSLLSAEVNGAAAPEVAIEAARIALPAARLRPGRNSVRLAYENAYDPDGSGCHRAKDASDGRSYVFTDFEPFHANRLFPCFDQPDVKATYALSVAAPADWTVISNGAEVSSVADGGKIVHRFRRTARFSTYVTAVCAGPFAVWHDEKARIPSRIFSTQSMAKHVDVAEVFEITRQGFDFFETYFGIPYPYGKYDQVFVPEFNWGAMENVGCVVHGDHLVFRHVPTDRERQDRALVVLHEMAHMWFGNLVTMEWWDDLWLNESFATYMATIAATRATRFKDGFDAFRQGEKRWAYWQDELPTTHPIAASVPDTLNAFTNFDGITYGKGASVLKQLAFFVGDDTFRRGVAGYLARHAGKNARLEHFLAAIGEAAGRDLSAWSSLWLSTSGVNSIAPVVRTSSGRVDSLTLEQGEGNGDRVLRPHRLRVAAYAEDPAGNLVLSRAVDVEVTGRTTRVDAFLGLAAPAFVFANHEDHAYVKSYLDPASLAYATRRLERLPSPLLRAEVWAIAYDMVRDRRSRPEAFLDLFLAKAHLESNDKLVASILRSLRTVLSAYVPDSTRARYAREAFDLAWSLATKAPASSDLQKTWADAAVATAEHQEALDRLVALLDGQEFIEGLELDVVRRWSMVTRLCAFGHSGARALLAAQRAADATDRGERAAFRAEVSFPEPDAKAAAWRRFTGDGAASLDLLREGMGGFTWSHQREVLRPFLPRFFEDVRATASRRELQFGTAFVGHLFPDALIERATVDSAKAFLDGNPALPAHLRRALVEKSFELERAVGIRAALE